ncbi:methyl-accepting chemotaxis protein [Desulfomicrobium sp. ZS1]|uniref:methyl-accepting chemotaxis protein n=1 Tax=Desulfomicrobium sp. ZS1 TaxID=2952228 RepID=UPI0020B3C328|nr:methyl-accepting chemotaxis protein [Desulfomicrobium sp. ZS1]UTF51559.1 methyl-accepting chemotaxis protein [Desulfomicrobium sp. ZS1]
MPHEKAHLLQELGSVMEECASSLPILLPRLAGVIKDREEEFLGLGSTIFGINSKANTFSATASAMASSVGEGALHAAIGELQTRADEAKAVFSSVSSTEQLQGMSEVLGLIRSLDQAMAQFFNMVQTLKVLEITTRIESARLGSAGAGFTTLADDVRALGTIIDEHTEKIREHSNRLMNQVTTASERSKMQIASQKRIVEDMFTELFAGISELESMRTHSAGLVQDLAHGSRQVTESMGQVIASVQFHDITRQQVEHVEEILEQAVREISTRGEDDAGLGAWVRDVLTLQAPQLRQAQEMFSGAVEELIGNLISIGHGIEDLHGKITAVAYADRKGGVSILDAIRHHIGDVTNAMRTTSGDISETSKTMSHMAETISTVSTFVHGIEDIGAEIELIALNARVKAAHTGDQGRTLGVIAMEIQNLSVDARARTGTVAEILNRISSVAERLSTLARDSDVSEMVGGIQGRFETVLDHLAGLDAELGTNVAHLSELSTGLVSQINALTSSIHFHDLVSGQLLNLEKEITVLKDTFAPFSAELDTARQPEKLREQLSRYTMDSERLVHLSVLGHHGDAHDNGEVDLFGDNDVELFGDDDVELFTNDNVELFDDDNVELFADANVELFDGQPSAPKKKAEPEEDLGDNVELF